MAILSNPPAPGLSGTLRRCLPPWWTGYSLALFFPLSILGFLLTGPHQPLGALLWTLPMFALVLADLYGPAETRMTPPEAPRGFFDGILYFQVLIQIANVLALGLMVSRLRFGSGEEILASVADLLAIRAMVGANFVCGAICPAHELIHRRKRWQRRLGRLLLGTLGYDHFAVAHKRAHHAKLGSRGDPSTAWPDEAFDPFVRRSMAQQWWMAWFADRRAVLTGIVVQAIWALIYLSWFGPLALLVMGSQAFAAVRHLEAVNYFQHFGLTDDSGRAPLTAWRCHSAISLFIFIGLTRHADHHRRPGIPYPDLKPLEGPELPYGYLGTAVMVQRRNAAFLACMAERIQRVEKGGWLNESSLNESLSEPEGLPFPMRNGRRRAGRLADWG